MMPADTTQQPTRPAPGTGPGQAPDRAGRLCIVMNPASGKQGTPDLDQAVRAFARDHADRIELRELAKGQSPVEAAARAVDEGFGTIVAAGGDGTIGGVAAAVHGSGADMGVLPMGTFNYFARGLDIPLDIEAALALLLEGTPHPVTVAEVNGKLFLNNTSLGIYPAILAKRESVYRRWGRSRLAAYWSVILTLAGFRRARTLLVTVDGITRRRRTPLIFVAHSAYQLEEFGLDGAETVRRGRFAVFLAPDVGRWGLVKHAVLLMGRSMTKHRDFEMFEGEEIEIEAAPSRLLVARDGERERMETPICIRRCADPLPVIVPRDTPRSAAQG